MRACRNFKGEVAFGTFGTLSALIGLTENLRVKNADKILLTDFNDTLVASEFGNIIHTGKGADTIWLGTNGVAIDDPFQGRPADDRGRAAALRWHPQCEIRQPSGKTPGLPFVSGPRTFPARCSKRSPDERSDIRGLPSPDPHIASLMRATGHRSP